ncbi:MAG: threonine ammonia-lyase [Euryarchaeota archaeon]|nr:threonine ammonia-lyase [Euryarchaeota archaeon]
MPGVTLEDIKRANRVVEGAIHRTRLEYSKTFSAICGGEIYLKTENLQRTGSFKIRGALNKIASIPAEEREKGVIAASMGNHAQGVAHASQIAGIKCTIVMPETASITKVVATRGYGAEVILHGREYDEAYGRALEMQLERGYTYIHAFDDPHIIAGQGTIGLEILEKLPEVDQVVVPVGGGGLISGIAVALKETNPGIKVYGVEAENMPAMKASLERGTIVSLAMGSTIADGIAIKSPGRLTFDLTRKYVDGVVTVTEEEIAGTILLLLERAKLVVEGAGAVALAACLHGKVDCKGKRTVAVLSGGNIDTNMVSLIIERGLVKEGRYLNFSTIIKDQVGELKGLLALIVEEKANVITIRHNRIKLDVPIGYARVELLLETWGKEHSERILRAMRERGFQVALP